VSEHVSGFAEALTSLEGTAFSPHRFDYALDLSPLLVALSPPARVFYWLANFEHLDDDGRISDPEKLWAYRFCDAPVLLAKFLELSDPDRTQVLTVYTLGLHEGRHLLDCTTTPFAARFYTMLVQEYLTFQRCSPYLLQHQDVIPAGPVGTLPQRLADAGKTIPEEERPYWGSFTATLANLQGAIDVRGLAAPRTDGIATDEPPVRAGGLSYQAVRVRDRVVTYEPSNHPHWYLRASTLLEGRAVIASLLWIIHTLGLGAPVGKILHSYLRDNYGPDKSYDYRFLLDATAAASGHADLDTMLRQDSIEVLRYRLHLMDNAAWFALQAGFHVGDDQVVRPESIFRRYLFAIGKLQRAFVEGSAIPPYQILAEAETSAHASQAMVASTDDALTSAIKVIDGTEPNVAQIWQSQIAEHFRHVLGVVRAALVRRRGDGIAFPPGAPVNGNPVNTLDDASYKDLYQRYQPGRWVRDWFTFRDACFFNATKAQVTLKHLRAQFGLAEVAVNCLCGAIVVKPVPKWRPDTVVTCPGCGRRHPVRSDDLTYHWVDDD
jgi:hypothetical protein